MPSSGTILKSAPSDELYTSLQALATPTLSANTNQSVLESTGVIARKARTTDRTKQECY
jgi:hypothetical protein